MKNDVKDGFFKVASTKVGGPHKCLWAIAGEGITKIKKSGFLKAPN